MRILLKCPTRSRPQQVIATLKKYINLANQPKLIGIAVSCDVDDVSMTRNLVREEIETLVKKVEWGRVYYGNNRSKIEACNANMHEIGYNWDIVVLVSDDMIPQVNGYDDIIRNQMIANFPDTNGILWFNDGCQAEKLNTLCIYGRTFYERQGYIYHPAYKSLFCDTELTDLCRTDYKNICLYIPYCIIRHEHPGTGFAERMDALYQSNQKYWNEDMYTYISRKRYEYDWSVMIPSMVGREAGLKNLIESIREKVSRIAPEIRVEYCLDIDNRETSIGLKRERLLQSARGKYSSFVDDDDNITDAYIEDLRETIRGNYHVMRLYGEMGGYNFVHSTEMKLSSPMAATEPSPRFQRPPNHLNPMMCDVAKFVHFKNATYGEDLDWCITMLKRGFLEREYRREPIQVQYIYNLGNRNLHPKTFEMQQTTSYETMLSMVFTPVGAAMPPRPNPQERKETIGLRLGPRGFVSTQ